MQRITIKNLRALCDTLNQRTGSPMFPWARADNGHGPNVAQIGCYIIDCAYGGYQLGRIMNESGGQSSPLGLGFSPARDLYERMHAYMRGMDDANQTKGA